MIKLLLGGVWILAVAAALMLTVGCEGPTGPSGTAECFQCHAEDTEVRAIQGQWAASVHATGGNFERNTSPCLDCHTHEGFVERISGGDLDVSSPSNIHCFTCHEPHESGNFELRTEAAVELEMGGTVDLGEGNLCANCHQARTPAPELGDLSAGGTTKITSSRWGPHHGPQSNMLAGSGGYELAATGITYNDSYHTQGVTEGCPTCHMATPYGAQAGGHTMSVTYDYHGSERQNLAGCNTADCHGEGGLSDFNYEGKQDIIVEKLEALRQALIAEGILTESDSAVPGTYPDVVLAALFNYKFVEEDRSNGVHNYKYARDLLDASLATLGQ